MALGFPFMAGIISAVIAGHCIAATELCVLKTEMEMAFLL
jgi:hypothetical protein